MLGKRINCSFGGRAATCQIKPKSYSSRRITLARAETAEVPELNDQLQQIADSICGLTLMEAADLSKYLEDKLGVSAAAAPMMAAMPVGAAGGGDAPAAEEAKEKTEFTVKLTGFDASGKIKLIKELRSCVDGLGMKEAKELVEGAPSVVRADVPKSVAEEIKEKLEGVGGKVDIE